MDEILKALERGHGRKALKLMELHGPSLPRDALIRVLWQASVSGHAAVAEAALRLGAPLEAADGEGTTALMRAALLKRADVIRILMAAGADANLARRDGRTALTMASVAGDAECVEALLTTEADPGSERTHAEGALASAVEEGRWEVAELWLKKGTRAGGRLADGTPILCRLAFRAPHLVEPALAAGADVAAVEPLRGRTPLHFAASAGNASAVRLLISHGAPVDARADNGWTPLLSALAESTRRDGDRQATVGVLLGAGADVRVTTPDGYGVLAFALTWSGREAFGALLAAGAPVTPSRPGLSAPTHIAAARGYLEEMVALLEAGADMEYRATGEELTALHFAAAGGSVAVPTAEMLLYRGARVNVWSADGRSVVAMAAQRNSVAMVYLLLGHGASVHPRSPRDVVPLTVAAVKGHTDVVVALLEAGADPDADGLTGHALEQAVGAPHVRVVSALLAAGADPDLGTPPPLIRAMTVGTWDDRHPYRQPRSRKTDIAADTVEMLLDAGADPNVSHDGRSALDLARSFRSPEVARMIKRAAGR